MSIAQEPLVWLIETCVLSAMCPRVRPFSACARGPNRSQSSVTWVFSQHVGLIISCRLTANYKRTRTKRLPWHRLRVCQWRLVNSGGLQSMTKNSNWFKHQRTAQFLIYAFYYSCVFYILYFYHVASEVTDVPWYSGVVPRADTCLGVEKVHLALLRGPLLCRKT